MTPRALAGALAASLALHAAGASAQHHHHAQPTVDAAAPSPDAAVDAPPVADVPTAAAARPPADEPEHPTLPLARGLPVLVRVAAQFVEVQSVDENDEAFTGTLDLRMQWDDPRVAVDAADAPDGYREWRGPEADAKLDAMWWPAVQLDNLVGDAAHQFRGLRVTTDGHVELMQRTTGAFRCAFDAARFPFDTQRLQVALSIPHATEDQVDLDFRQDDLDFSRQGESLSVAGWTPDLVTLRRDPLGGWHGEQHARVVAELEIARQAERTAPAIFIPLLASLLIPLLAVWLNRVRRSRFTVEAFELTNVVVGGLFAVIALNFTVNAEYRVIASGDNTVSRLFALNYLTLGASLLINIAVYRFNVVSRLFGPMVEEQVYRACLWAVPVLSLSTAAAIVAAAMA